MKRSSTLFAVVAGAAATLLALSGCSASGTTPSGSDGPPQAGGDLVMARSASVMTLLPSRVAENGSLWVTEEILDTLLVPSRDGKTVEPSLA
mgnify:FL=1